MIFQNSQLQIELEAKQNEIANVQESYQDQLLTLMNELAQMRKNNIDE